MERHFVVFYSPGTFVAETSEREIERWDVEKAKEIARGIVERYNATPYAFQFITRSRGDEDLDSHISKRSGTYYLGGKIETLEEVKARATLKDMTLIANMEGNGWDRIIINNNSWSWSQPFEEGDVLLDWP